MDVLKVRKDDRASMERDATTVTGKRVAVRKDRRDHHMRSQQAAGPLIGEQSGLCLAPQLCIAVWVSVYGGNEACGERR